MDGVVLLVDDEVEITEMLGEEMQRRNIPFIVADNGKLALELIESKKPRVIVSDYKMPGLNGIELLQYLRNLKSQIPVIWVTGYADSETARRAWEMGVFHLFEKPVDIREVGLEVEKALSITPESMVSFQPTYLTDVMREKHFQKVQIEIDKALYEKVRTRCLENAISINSYVLQLLQKSVD